MEAGLYAEVLHDTDKAVQLLHRLKADFPATQAGRPVASTIDVRIPVSVK